MVRSIYAVGILRLQGRSFRRGIRLSRDEDSCSLMGIRYEVMKSLGSWRIAMSQLPEP